MLSSAASERSSTRQVSPLAARDDGLNCCQFRCKESFLSEALLRVKPVEAPLSRGILVRCQGPCLSEVNSAELDSNGWCALCAVVESITPDFERYKTLYAKYRRYSDRRHPTLAIQKALTRQVSRIARACHARLPVKGATKLLNDILERGRAEVDGYNRILTPDQARTK